MTDEQLIAEVARVWVDGGGDADGLDWCHQKLKEAVNSEIENRTRAVRRGSPSPLRLGYDEVREM